jgi:hypothetical protein
MGLHGSRYLVDHLDDLGVARHQLAAMLNLDMIGSLRGDRLHVFSVGSSPAWPDHLEPAAGRRGLTLQLHDGGAASDHLPFVLAEVPALHFFTGVHRRYHRPADTPEHLNAAGAVRVIDLVEAVAVSLWTGASAPAFAHGDGVNMTPPRAFLGVQVDPIPGTEPGVRITGLVPEGPAIKAGLQPDDVITAVDGQATPTLRDLLDLLQERDPGDTVTLSIRRDDAVMQQEAVLGRR